jgi:RNA ligase (TIGR02306 family)
MDTLIVEEPSERLATIEIISNISEIPGADNIVCVDILGWQCVAKRNEFKTGDKCVYICIDSIVPDAPWVSWLTNKHITTHKFKGQISQGLALPLAVFNEPSLIHLSIGSNVTDILGIIKYEKNIPAHLMGHIRGYFPTAFISKTDEVRIQSYLRLLDEMAGLDWVATQKVDGTSATYLIAPMELGEFKQDEFLVCSRNTAKKRDDINVYWQMAERYNIEQNLRQDQFKHYAIQGEICGPGIQKNKLGLKEVELFVFNVYDMDLRQYLNHDQMVDVCVSMGLQIVKEIYRETNFNKTLQELLELAKGTYNNGSHQEGIVIRPICETYSQTLRSRLSFKVINNDFLLKNKE